VFAGVPRGKLGSSAATCGMFGIPVEGLPLILPDLTILRHVRIANKCIGKTALAPQLHK